MGRGWCAFESVTFRNICNIALRGCEVDDADPIRVFSEWYAERFSPGVGVAYKWLQLILLRQTPSKGTTKNPVQTKSFPGPNRVPRRAVRRRMFTAKAQRVVWHARARVRGISMALA